MQPTLRFSAFAVFVLLVFSYFPPRFSGNDVRTGTQPYPTVLGAIHVASNVSTGSLSAEQIAAEAQRAGLDFVVLADPGSTPAQRVSVAKSYAGAVDVFSEFEAETPGGHLLFFHSHTPLVEKADKELSALAWKHYLGDRSGAESFVAIAHPSSPKAPWNRLDRFAEGLEVMSFETRWRRLFAEESVEFLGSLLLAPFNSFLTALRFNQPSRKDLTTWDTMNSLYPGGFGYLSSDLGQSLPLPSYYSLFRTGCNAVFPEGELSFDFRERQRQIYSALRQGRLAFFSPAIFPFSGNSWTVRCEKSVYRSGDSTVEDFSGCRFEFSLPPGFPYPAKAILVRGGEEAQTIDLTSGSASVPVKSAGSYRAEIWINPPLRTRLLLGNAVPYLFYNPISIR